MQENEIEQQADDSEGEAAEEQQEDGDDKPKEEEEDEEYSKLDEIVKQSKMPRDQKLALNASLNDWDSKMMSLIEQRNNELENAKKK